jgi:uncharacterized protein
MLKELRFVSAAELRAYAPDGVMGGDEDQRDVGGYAAVFNSPTVIAGYFREQVAPGAFLTAITRDDVRALFNHDANYVLGRNRAGTLKLSEDERGLVWRATPPKTSWAADLAVSIERGDISGCSFSFVPTVEEWDFSDDLPMRTIRECELYDVSAVTYPAYDDTSVAMRSAAESLVATHRQGLAVPMSPAARAKIAARKRQLDSLIRA